MDEIKVKSTLTRTGLKYYVKNESSSTRFENDHADVLFPNRTTHSANSAYGLSLRRTATD